MREKVVAIFKNYIPSSMTEYDDKENFLSWELTESEFHNLWKMEIIEKLSMECDLIINRFEDTDFIGHNLKKALEIISKESLLKDIPELQKLKSFFEDGIKRNTGVYFSF